MAKAENPTNIPVTYLGFPTNEIGNKLPTHISIANPVQNEPSVNGNSLQKPGSIPYNSPDESIQFVDPHPLRNFEPAYPEPDLPIEEARKLAYDYFESSFQFISLTIVKNLFIKNQHTAWPFLQLRQSQQEIDDQEIYHRSYMSLGAYENQVRPVFITRISVMRKQKPRTQALKELRQNIRHQLQVGTHDSFRESSLLETIFLEHPVLEKILIQMEDKWPVPIAISQIPEGMECEFHTPIPKKMFAQNAKLREFYMVTVSQVIEMLTSNNEIINSLLPSDEFDKVPQIAALPKQQQRKEIETLRRGLVFMQKSLAEAHLKPKTWKNYFNSLF